jgi:hypothetical protein
VLCKVHKLGHVSELLVTFGLSYIVLELVQLLWGRVAVEFNPPVFLQGPVFTLINHGQLGLSLVSGAGVEMCQSADTRCALVCTPFPATRGFHHGYGGGHGDQPVGRVLDPHPCGSHYSSCANSPRDGGDLGT